MQGYQIDVAGRGNTVNFDAGTYPWAYTVDKVWLPEAKPSGGNSSAFLLKCAQAQSCDITRSSGTGSVSVATHSVSGAYKFYKALGVNDIQTFANAGLQYLGVVKGPGFMKCEFGNTVSPPGFVTKHNLLPPGQSAKQYYVDRCVQLCQASANKCQYVEWLPLKKECRVVHHCGKMLRDTSRFSADTFAMLFKHDLTGFKLLSNPLFTVDAGGQFHSSSPSTAVQAAMAMASGGAFGVHGAQQVLQYKNYLFNGLNCKDNYNCKVRAVADPRCATGPHALRTRPRLCVFRRF
jgi:hypothetical protein